MHTIKEDHLKKRISSGRIDARKLVYWMKIGRRKVIIWVTPHSATHAPVAYVVYCSKNID